MKNSLFQIFPFNLSLDIFFGDEDKAKSILPDGLVTAIDTLYERERTVLYLRYRDGLILKEVGDKLGVTTERARQVIRVSVNALRKPDKTALFKAVPLQEKILLEDEVRKLMFERDTLSQSCKDAGSSAESILRAAKAEAVYQKLLDKDILKLDIPNGLKTFLLEAGIFKVRQLIDTRDLTKIKRIGPYHAKIINQALNEIGFP